MKKELTARQEKFCQCVAVDKMNLTNAYRAAYSTDNMTDKSVNEKGCTTSKKDKIKSRINAIKAEIYDRLQDEIVYSKKQSFEKLSDIQKKAEGKEQYNIATKNEELKGKMLGYYEDTLNLKGSKDHPIETNITVTFVDKK